MHENVGGAVALETVTTLVIRPAFLASSGELGGLIAELDWSTTSLGPIDSWPQVVRTTVALILQSPVPIVTLWGEDGVMIYNDAYSSFAGARHPCLLGSKVREGWPEVAEFNDNVMQAVLGRGETLSYRDQELTLFRQDKEEQVWMNLDYSAVLNDNGTRAGVIAVVVETSGKVRAEQRLSGERERLGQMFDIAPGFMAIVEGPEHHFVMANRAFHDLVGRDVMGKTVAEALPDIVDPEFIDLLDDAARSGEPCIGRAMPVRLVGDDGTVEKFIDFLFQPMSSAEGEMPGIFIQGSEVTEHKGGEALQRAQQLESIGKLAGGMAHDFNNLLQIVSGNLQLLASDVPGNARAEARLANAMAGVNRGARLAGQLLAFGRRQPLEPKVVNVARLVGGMDDLLRRSIGEAIEIETVISARLWNAFVDPSHFESAVLNLALNARDAMDGVGKLTIEFGNADLDPEYAARNSDVKPGQYVMIAVTDTGTGIPPELIERVFEPFFTTKAGGKGSGLGLSMVYGFVNQSGGHVKIDSEVGHGTSIRMYLPRIREDEDQLAGPEVVEAGGGSETILVVEDDEEVRATVTDMLGDLGYNVLTAKDAASALPILESGVKVDLLFTDVVMPGPLRSPELARKAKEQMPSLAILFTSGYTEDAIVHGGRLDPGVNLLTKPYSRELLASRIRRALDERAGSAG